MQSVLIVACFLLITRIGYIHGADVDFYTAGVVEFSQLTTKENGFNARLQAYLNIISSVEAEPTDILVFPESTLNDYELTTFLPVISENAVPCLEKTNKNGEAYQQFLCQLSCAARSAKKYLVVNVKEQENCVKAAVRNNDTRPCASNNLNKFNTNVVFDRQGQIISTYRKFNVYTEPSNQTLLPEYGIFDTDFGVKFGHFICFDINFYQPAEELVTRFGIQNLILTIHFYSELPFLTAVQLQQGWAWGNNVNLIAAGASSPFEGTTGTGIFSGGLGALDSLMTGDFGVRKLLVTRVPKKPAQLPINIEPRVQREPQTKISLMQDPKIESFNSVLIDFQQDRKISQELCDHGHCCKFDIETDTRDNAQNSVWYQYRIGVFNGRRSYVKRVFSDLLVCAVYACTNSNANSCGLIFKDENLNVQPNFIFKSISVQGIFVHAEKMLLMPSSVDTALYPLPTSEAEWIVTKNGSNHHASFKLKNQAADLLTFGIYGNYYLRNSPAFF